MEREPEHWKGREVARLLALVEAERRYYQEIVAGIPVGLLIVSSDLAVISSNREIRRILGFRPGEPAVQSVESLFPPEVADTVRSVLQSGAPGSVSMRSGEPERALTIHVQRIRNWEDDPQPEALLTVETAIAAGIGVPPPGDGPVPAAEVLDSLDAIVWAVEVPSMRFLYVNEKAQDLLGYPVEKWLRSATFWSDRIHLTDRNWVLNAYRRSIANWSRLNCEFRAVSSHDRPVWLRESARMLQDPQGRARHLIGVAVDVTRRHMLDGQTAQSQRVEAANALARRVAEEITNQVTVISGYSEQLLSAMGPSNPLGFDLRAIQTATAKLETLAAQLSSAQPRLTWPGTVLDLMELLRPLDEGSSLELEWKLFPSPVHVRVDPQWMSHFLALFVKKAKQNRAGRLKIECAPMEIEEVVTPSSSALACGDYAMVTFTDDGETMSCESREALFDSILPSRELEDLGPGLAKAYSFVRQWGGNISVLANLPKGNVIQIYLPVAVGPDPGGLNVSE